MKTWLIALVVGAMLGCGSLRPRIHVESPSDPGGRDIPLPAGCQNPGTQPPDRGVPSLPDQGVPEHAHASAWGFWR